MEVVWVWPKANGADRHQETHPGRIQSQLTQGAKFQLLPMRHPLVVPQLSSVHDFLKNRASSIRPEARSLPPSQEPFRPLVWSYEKRSTMKNPGDLSVTGFWIFWCDESTDSPLPTGSVPGRLAANFHAQYGCVCQASLLHNLSNTGRQTTVSVAQSDSGSKTLPHPKPGHRSAACRRRHASLL